MYQGTEISEKEHNIKRVIPAFNILPSGTTAVYIPNSMSSLLFTKFIVPL